jgi:CubicO group peptidase (beta-lactamase class C family)
MFMASLKYWGLVPSLLFCSAAIAAPYADPKLVELWSHMDEFHAAHSVPRAAAPRELKRAAPDRELETLLDAFLAAHPNTGLLVLKGDTILAERYQYGRTAQNRFASSSLATTVVGMLVGVAIADGRIKSIEEPVWHHVPALTDHAYGHSRIRDLLTMSSGIGLGRPGPARDDGFKLIANTLRRETQGGPDTIREFNQNEISPGKRFRYAAADAQVLGLVLQAAVHEPLAGYLSEKIWRPMGAEAHASWLTDKAGQETAFCCLNAVLRDYARFGMLLANYGALDGKQIIPAEWVKAATTASARHLKVGSATKDNGYGYQTWITHPSAPHFAALGLHGQAIYVDPVRKLVVVHTAVWVDGDDSAERGAQLKLWASLLERFPQP